MNWAEFEAKSLNLGYLKVIDRRINLNGTNPEQAH